MCQKWASNWHVNSSTIDQAKLYTELSQTFAIILSVHNPQVYFKFTYNYVAEFSILVLKNMLAGKVWNLEGEFRNLSAKFFGGLNSKISTDNHACNELLRIFRKFEAKILKNVRGNPEYNFFLVNCWRIDMSMVGWCWTQLVRKEITVNLIYINFFIAKWSIEVPSSSVEKFFN